MCIVAGGVVEYPIGGVTGALLFLRRGDVRLVTVPDPSLI